VPPHEIHPYLLRKLSGDRESGHLRLEGLLRRFGGGKYFAVDEQVAREDVANAAELPGDHMVFALEILC
jgi:hypothetical protein